MFAHAVYLSQLIILTGLLMLFWIFLAQVVYGFLCGLGSTLIEFFQALVEFLRFVCRNILWIILASIILITFQVAMPTVIGKIYLAIVFGLPLLGFLIYGGVKFYRAWRDAPPPPVALPDPYADTREWLRGLRFTRSSQ